MKVFFGFQERQDDMSNNQKKYVKGRKQANLSHSFDKCQV